MLIAALVIGVVALVAISVFATWVVGGKLLDRQAPEPLQISQRVVVNLKTGTAITGVMTINPSGFLIVKGAEVVEPGHNPVPADGEILVDQANVDYIQAL